MAYSINGKVYTEHPLMDELVYNTKLIIADIVLKNDVRAFNNETESSIKSSDTYISIKQDSMTFDLFPFTAEILSAYGYTDSQVKEYLNDRYSIPEDQRDDLLSFSCDYYVTNYEEENNYYRSLNGLPNYNTTEYDIYIDASYLPSNVSTEGWDFTIPIHEFAATQIAILSVAGVLDDLREEYTGTKYRYLKYLGDMKIDIYTARCASKWDILYMPSVEKLVEDRFQELFILNREIYLKRTYQEAYAYASDYYEEMMMVILICQTFADIVVDTPEWYIRRDIFDIRSVQYFLEAYGVEYYKEIPLKYQIRIVKSLNKLIRYKSSDKNIDDILEVFSLKNTAVYKYYLFKKQNTDASGFITEDGTNTDKYSLEFVQCKMGESYDDYIKDMIYRTPYDDITKQDEYWDGVNDHAYVKQCHLAKDFTIEGTKYMSVDYKISMQDYMFQMEYFLGLLFNSKLNMDDVKIAFPSIQENVTFRLSDLFLFLYVLTLSYEDISGIVTTPVNKRYGEKPEFTKYDDYDGGYVTSDDSEYGKEINNWYPDMPTKNWRLGVNGGVGEYGEVKSREEYYDWLKWKHPEVYDDVAGKIYGFNMNADLTTLQETIGFNHSAFKFQKGFTLADLGVDTFIAQTEIDTLDDLIRIYNNNADCYDALKEKITYCTDRDTMVIYQYAFDYLFTRDFDYDFYTLSNGNIAETLSQLLKERDYVLYSSYADLMKETNVETRQDNIRSIMNDVVNTLEYYLNGDRLDLIFGFTTVASFSSLIKYIYYLITFFKSYKVYFLDPYITYIANDKMENSLRYTDKMMELRLNYLKADQVPMVDKVELETSFEFEDGFGKEYKEVMDVNAFYSPDPEDDLDYNGYDLSETSPTSYNDIDGGVTDNALCIPFIMVNGGGFKHYNLWDLNGARPMEMDDAVDLDAGSITNQEDETRKDYWASAYTYIIDGGCPGGNTFLTSSMRTRVINNVVSAEVLFSSIPSNHISYDESGILVENSFISVDDYYDQMSSYETTYNQYEEICNDMVNNVVIDLDNDEFKRRCDSFIVAYLSPANNIILGIENGIYLNQMNSYTDQTISELYSTYKDCIPISWGEF